MRDNPKHDTDLLGVAGLLALGPMIGCGLPYPYHRMDPKRSVLTEGEKWAILHADEMPRRDRGVQRDRQLRQKSRRCR